MRQCLGLPDSHDQARPTCLFECGAPLQIVQFRIAMGRAKVPVSEHALNDVQWVPLLHGLGPTGMAQVVHRVPLRYT